MRQCYHCGYLLSNTPDTVRCSECGCTCRSTVQRRARRCQSAPGQLFLNAVLLWRTMPEGLWRANVSAPIIDILCKNTRRLAVFWITACVFLLFFVGPFRVNETSFAADSLDAEGRVRQLRKFDPSEPDGPFILVVSHDVLGEQRRPSWIRVNLNEATRYALTNNYFNYQAPRFTCATPLPRYRDWALYPVYSVIVGEDEGWRFTPAVALLDLRRAFMLVFLPLTCWQMSVILLRLFSRFTSLGTSSTQHDLDRRAALIAISRAAFVPIRLAWIGAFLLVVPLLAAPNTTHAFRSAAFWVLLAVGTTGPFVVTTRAWCADRVFRIARGRFIPAATLLIFGCILPAMLGRKLVYAVTYYIGIAAYRAIESSG